MKTLNIEENKIMAFGPKIFMVNTGIKKGSIVRYYFLGLQNHCRWLLLPEIERHLLLGGKAMTHLNSVLKIKDITLHAKVCIVKAMIFFCSHVWI